MGIGRFRGWTTPEPQGAPEPPFLDRRRFVAGGLGIVGAAAGWPAWPGRPASAADGASVKGPPPGP